MRIKNSLLASGAFGGMTANEQRLGRFLRDGAGHPEPALAAAAPTPAPDPTPPAAEPPAPEPTADDAFASAFAEHAAGTPPAAEPSAVPAAAAPEPPAASASEPPAPAAAEPGAASAAATPPVEPAKPELNAEDVLNRLADLVKPGAAPPAPAPAAAPAAEAPPVFTADEQVMLAEYEKNWPDVAKAEAVKRRAEYGDVFRIVFDEMHRRIAPLLEQQRAVGNALHLTELKGLVPDYTENLETDVAAWVGTQPSYLQTAMKTVMQTGTSDEIADLIGRYRAATGTVPPQPQGQAPAPAGSAPAAPAPAASKPPTKTELSSAAKQAAESLAPVSGDRSAVPQGEDTQDFDSAFSRFAAMT